LLALALGGTGVAALGEDLGSDGRWRISIGYSKGKPGDPRIERNKRDPKFMFVDPAISKADLLEVLLANPQARTVSEDGSGTITSYELQNLKWARDVEEWNREGCRSYLIEPPIG
jgi:hypothetical protein